MTEIRGIDYFGRNHPLAQLHTQATLKVRRQIYDWFSNTIGGITGKVFLDHGSTPDTLRQDSNCFIRWLIEDGAKVYATSPEDITFLENVFPITVVTSFPPSKSSFGKLDCIISSAVIEHVGSEESQIEYLTSLLQLHPKILLTTPNRYHWLEFHTKLPFLHWLPRDWHRVLLAFVRMKFWASEKNLSLLSKQDLLRVIETSSQMTGLKLNVSWCQPKFLGMTSNLVVLLEERGSL